MLCLLRFLWSCHCFSFFSVFVYYIPFPSRCIVVYCWGGSRNLSCLSPGTDDHRTPDLFLRLACLRGTENKRISLTCIKEMQHNLESSGSRATSFTGPFFMLYSCGSLASGWPQVFLISHLISAVLDSWKRHNKWRAADFFDPKADFCGFDSADLV